MTTRAEPQPVLPQSEVIGKPAKKVNARPAGPAMERLCLAANAYSEAVTALNGCHERVSDAAYQVLVETFDRTVRSLDNAACARGAEKERQKRAPVATKEAQP